MSKKAKTTPTSLVTFLLDRSGSMFTGVNTTIEAFNGYLDGLKAEKDACIDFTFVQFDTHDASMSLNKICAVKPIAEVAPLSLETYQPRGGTPLIDAAYTTILATAKAIEARSDKPKVVFCIQTDGQENASSVYNWSALKELIGLKTAEGWQFVFMGAGIDAYDQAAKMGVGFANTVSYDRTNEDAVRNTFTASACNTVSFAAGRSSTVEYTTKQRVAAGDQYAAARFGQTTAKIDVTGCGLSATPNVRPLHRSIDLSAAGVVPAAPEALDLTA